MKYWACRGLDCNARIPDDDLADARKETHERWHGLRLVKWSSPNGQVFRGNVNTKHGKVVWELVNDGE